MRAFPTKLFDLCYRTTVDESNGELNCVCVQWHARQITRHSVRGLYATAYYSCTTHFSVCACISSASGTGSKFTANHGRQQKFIMCS